MSKYKRSNARDDNMTELILGSGLHPWSRKKKGSLSKNSHGTGYRAKHGLFQLCRMSTRFLLYPDSARLKILPFLKKF